MKNLATSIMLVLGTIPLAASAAYQLTVVIDGQTEVHVVDSATLESTETGALLTVTGLDTGGGGSSGPYAPIFTSPSTYSLQENTTAVGTVSATDQDGDAVSYSLAGGSDQALFNLIGDALSFKTAPDFEDASHGTAYNVQVSAVGTTGTTVEETTTKSITVNVTNDTSDDSTGGGGSCGALPSGAQLAYAIPDIENPGGTTVIRHRSTIKAMGFVTTDRVNYQGQFSFAAFSGTETVNRNIWISECPGVPFTSVESLCRKSGKANAVVNWGQATSATWDCELELNKQYYINIQNTNCPTGVNCNSYRDIYTN